MVASREECSTQNERNVVTVRGRSHQRPLRPNRRTDRAPHRVSKEAGRHRRQGERVGLIKFGSRVDMFLGPEWEIKVQPGERVSGGSSILAQRRERPRELMARLTFKERFFDPRPPARRPRRAAYALPTLFTAGNIFSDSSPFFASEGALLAATGQLGPNPHSKWPPKPSAPPWCWTAWMDASPA